MKKIFSILATLVVFSLSVTAQSFVKGNTIVEGTVSYSKSSGSKSEYSIAPSVGCFMTEKFALGVSGEFGNTSDGKVTNFGAYGRYYFLNVEKGVKVFSQLNIGSVSDRFSTDLGIGANYFVSKRLALSANLTQLIVFDTGDKMSNFSVGFTGVNNPFSMARFGALLIL